MLPPPMILGYPCRRSTTSLALVVLSHLSPAANNTGESNMIDINKQCTIFSVQEDIVERRVAVVGFFYLQLCAGTHLQRFMSI